MQQTRGVLRDRIEVIESDRIRDTRPVTEVLTSSTVSATTLALVQRPRADRTENNVRQVATFALTRTTKAKAISITNRTDRADSTDNQEPLAGSSAGVFPA